MFHSSAAGHSYFGRSLTELGFYSRAQIELKRAIEIGGNDSVEALRSVGAIYLETGEHARAAEELETYLGLAPKAKDEMKIREIINQQRVPYC